MNKPNREPDFKHEWWEFYIEEQLQYNNDAEKCFNIKIIKDVPHWQNSSGEWEQYRSKTVNELYIQYQIERIFLH